MRYSISGWPNFARYFFGKYSKNEILAFSILWKSLEPFPRLRLTYNFNIYSRSFKDRLTGHDSRNTKLIIITKPILSFSKTASILSQDLLIRKRCHDHASPYTYHIHRNTVLTSFWNFLCWFYYSLLLFSHRCYSPASFVSLRNYQNFLKPLPLQLYNIMCRCNRCVKTTINFVILR